jgi:hypothetical protein
MTTNLFECDSGINHPNTNPHSRRRRRRIRKSRKSRISAPANAPLVRLPKHCARCDHNTFAIGPGKAMHAASLLCASCHRFHGWACRWLMIALGVAS